MISLKGFANIGRIAERVTAHGLDPATTAVAICNGTTPRQRHVRATLGTIAAVAAGAEFDGPVLFIIGRTAGLAWPGEETEEGNVADRAGHAQRMVGAAAE